MRAQWKKVLKDLNATFKRTKKSTAFEGMIITSDTEFFEKLGWRKGEEMPSSVIRFFSQAYRFAVAEIGYHGTDVNIFCAVVHVDEKTPHLQLYYVPVVDTWREKVYELDKDGKVLRNAKGSPIQAKDENGKSKTKLVHSPQQPKVCRSDFWAERGGQLSLGTCRTTFTNKSAPTTVLEEEMSEATKSIRLNINGKLNSVKRSLRKKRSLRSR